MTELERLIELIKKSLFKHIYEDCTLSESIADDLLADGVIVLPCKIGDTVYWIDGECISEGFITTILMVSDEINYTALTDYGEEIEFEDFEIGKTVFLTKEEAEDALRKENEGK